MSKRRNAGFGGPMGGGGGGMNPGNMMKQLQKMQEDMERAQQALGDEVFEFASGGGAIVIKITGHQRVQAITINPALLDTSDPDWTTDLQDLLVVAVNQAIEESQKRAAERMETITGNMSSMLPGGLGGLLG
jgi:hypothetical protein